jgi:UDP-N-acetylmuramate dehydrogenase
MVSTVLDELRNRGIKRALANASLARYTSWRIGGPGDYLCVVEEEQELLAAVETARTHHIPWLVLGGGNNVLVSDDGVEGLVILNRLRGLELIKNHHPYAACGAGVFFAKAAQFTARQGYTGLEWGVAIPGTVGGGVVNNAGAHASDVSQSLIHASVIDETGRREDLSIEDLAYRYRESNLKAMLIQQSTLVVTGCLFRLQTASPGIALKRVEELRQHRLRTQPVKEASAGSTFKNPEGNHAGALIDKAGLKGRRVGGAQFAPLHANFIINQGGATAEDVVELMHLAQNEVVNKFGVHLEPEVQFVGRWRQETVESLVGRAA